MLSYLPRPLSTALGAVNRFSTGFLPAPFRESMQLPWTGSDQRQFESVMHVIVTVNRLLPAPVHRFPLNACLLGMRARSGWHRAHRPLPRDRATPQGGPDQGQPGTKPQPPASARDPAAVTCHASCSAVKQLTSKPTH